MNVTTDFIRDKFKEYNQEYFEGSLNMPKFEVTHVKSYLGQYHWKYVKHTDILSESVIRISDMFDRSEKDVCNTIIHEMIHLYIRQNKIRDSRPHHGVVFKNIAARINRQGGWHIATTDSIAGCGLKYKDNKKTWVVACFKNNIGKYFQFVINEKYIDYYKRRFERNADYYRVVFVFRSGDDKKYSHFPECRSAVRGAHISKELFDEIKLEERENIFYAIKR